MAAAIYLKKAVGYTIWKATSQLNKGVSVSPEVISPAFTGRISLMFIQLLE